MNRCTISRAQKKATRVLFPVRAASLQRQCACDQHTFSGGAYDGSSEKRLQRDAASQAEPVAIPSSVDDVLRSPGRALDADSRAFMEPRFGHDFGHVRVHTDVRSAESAHAVNARAYTVGRDVVFGAGQYAPRTTDGQRLLAHELTHVIQQSGRTSGAPLTVGLPDNHAEREAEEVAAHVDQPSGSIHTPADEPARMVEQAGVPEFASSPAFLQRKPNAPRALQAPRFAGDRVLEACLNNLHTLEAGSGETIGDRGEAVKKVQQALLDLGFALPKFGADRTFGSETKLAVEAFQRSKGFTGRDVDGRIGPKTMDALDASFPPRKSTPTTESRDVPDKVEVKTEKKGEVEGEKKKDPEVKSEQQSKRPISSDRANPEEEDERAFQFTAEIDVQNKWQLAGSPGDKPEFCDFGVMQIGGKWNWKGIPLGNKLTLFSEPELDVNLFPLLCAKAPGITLQDNILKWTIMKDVWELALVGAFGLKDGWLKDWKDRPLTGLVGPELDWTPWGDKKNIWYNKFKFKLNVSSVWEKAPEGKKDLWGVQASVGIGYEF